MFFLIYHESKKKTKAVKSKSKKDKKKASKKASKKSTEFCG